MPGILTPPELATNRSHDPHEKPGRYQPKSRKPRFFAKMKESWASQSSKTRYFKTTAIVFTIICLFYWLSPSGVSVQPSVSQKTNPEPVGLTTGVNTPVPERPVDKPAVNTPPADSTKEPSKPASGSDSSPGKDTTKPPATGGDSVETHDADDAAYSTKKCSKSYSKEKPIVQYVLMIDAGSTGSRIHVYKFNNCGAMPELESEEFKMTEKSVGGLSAYKDDPVAAAKSLDPLMKVAMEHVPEKLKGCTPVAVKATAGLRLIGAEKADAILKQVRTHLENDYPFPVVSADKDGVALMDGSDEGVYAWITTNYLLGKIGGGEKGETAAIFDLGGGSTQIVFEPLYKSVEGATPEKLADGEHKYELNYGGHKFELYQHSHLKFGLMAARERIHQALIDELAKSKGSDKTWLSEAIVHPCILPGFERQVNVTLGEDKKHDVTFVGPSEPSSAQCRSLAEKLLNKDAACKMGPCSFNGVHQPALAKTFAKQEILVFSFFYDRMEPLGMPESFTLREMHDLTHAVCQGKKGWSSFESNPKAMAELNDRPEYCLDLSFMLALLHTGYDMPIDREVKIAKKIDGNELGWCLGASLPLLEANSGWKCQVNKIA
ncbi:guanosine-diphosphatase [Cordyceps fumosorosea ARSEF 2679]|uniref:guanosine-diphosphatase n=1 Tax=Cordyceps fumosorosea (strain ARSEF 2679) TaxID=1081104 RepID=A0A162JR04_CORFA|nr:guanosine-diphosphatase [Cordyceps fumosorosea ARSEF 2679]OAA72512.1 guanosine-diphosphatase [Cordyceps fumosorosea ARSEF 2679]